MYQEAIYLLVVIFILFVVLAWCNKTKEGFAVGLSANDIAGDIVEQQKQENNNNNNNNNDNEESECKPKDWWEDKPIKAIRSKIWGASYNVVSQPTDNIKAPFMITINSPNKNAPPGCLSVNRNGWQVTEICNEQTSSQRWKAHMINNQDEFEGAMAKAKEVEMGVGFTYGYRIDKVDYPFFLVINVENPALGLYYNGSALGVRPLGNYDDMKWDILQIAIPEPIITNKFNFYSKLTPEFQIHAPPNSGSLASQPIAGQQNILANPEVLKQMIQSVMATPTQNEIYGVDGPLKINIEMDDDMISKITGSEASNNASGDETIETFTSNQASNYPKNPMDIKVTLAYDMAEVTQTNPNTTTQVIPDYEIDPQGSLVEMGKTTIVKRSGDRVKCDESLCNPNMDDWVSKPYPCRACVPNSSDTW